MSKAEAPVLSVVVPLYNESGGLMHFHESLVNVLNDSGKNYEIIYCDDGSRDNTVELVKALCAHDKRIHLLALTRNFGKEINTTAGITAAKGDAIMTIDADGQHPVELIPKFIAKWQAGSLVVIGRRTNRQASFTKKLGSKLFYGVFRRVTGMQLDVDSSDYRLIDRSVQASFKRLTERNRITRGLIDWMGYERTYVSYDENQRLVGASPYSLRKLIKLAIDSVISLSLSPLYITAYIGAVVLPASVLLGLFMVINALFGDPLHLHATGGAYLSVFILFLVGILLVSQGIIGLYLSHIHSETQNRPLYIIDEHKSVGIDDTEG